MTAIPDRLALKLLVGMGCVLLLALLINDRNHWKTKTAHYAELLAAERGAHAATVSSYRAAAERARLADAANAARVRADQNRINERSQDEFQSRIAAARAAAERLRRRAEATAADPVGRRAAPVPALSAAAGHPDQTASQDGLPDADRMIATEQAIQLDELIQWVRRQAAVPANVAPGARQPAIDPNQ